MEGPAGSVTWVTEAAIVIKFDEDGNLSLIKDRYGKHKVESRSGAKDGCTYIRLVPDKG